MGFMDSFIKGLKSAANSIDKKAGLSGDSALGNLAAKAEQAYNEAVGNTSGQTTSQTSSQTSGQSTSQTSGQTAQSPAPAQTAASAVKLSGNYQTASNRGMSFEVPEEFEEIDSGAAEVQLAYAYGDDLSAYICVQEPGGGLPTEKAAASKGIMKYSSNGWINWRNTKVRYYGFSDASGYERLLMVSSTSSADVDLMLEQVLDHAAETFTAN